MVTLVSKSDEFVADGKEPAYVANAFILCNKKGYSDASNVPIKTIILHCNGYGANPIHVGPGKYISAIWVEDTYDWLDDDKKSGSDGMFSFFVSPEVKERARKYFGKLTTEDAERPDTKHGFVRTVLFEENVTISFIV